MSGHESAPRTYLVVTRGQLIYAAQARRLPVNWFWPVRRQLTAANGYRLVYSNPDAWIYEYGAPR